MAIAEQEFPALGQETPANSNANLCLSSITDIIRCMRISRGCWTMDLKTKAVTAAERCPDLYDAEACILHGPGFSKKVFWFELVPKWRAANDTLLY